ncbi:hypothetical protein Tco_1266145, partial [Tanacetum coccineum]
MLNTNNNLQTQTSNALHNAIMEASSKDRPPMLAPEGYMENYKNVSQDIRDQLNAEAEAVQIILTGIDNDIYSTLDACLNACEMWKAIERLKQGESINVQDLETNLYWEFGKFTSRDLNRITQAWQRFVTLVKQSQELKTVSYHKLYDILKQHQNEVNEIRAERLAPTRNKGKAIVNSSAPIYDQEPATVTEDDEMSKEKEIDKLMALISLSFKKIYKPTNNNLQNSSNISRANQDNSPRINKGIGHVSRECQKPNRAKDAAYHKEKMLLCKQDEAGVQLNAEQADWKDYTNDESNDQEQDDQDDTNELARERDLLASLIKKLKCEIDDSKNRNKFLETSNKALVDKLKDLMKFQAELDRYHDVNYASKVEIDCAKAKGDLMSYKMESKKSSNEYTRKINDLNQTISDMKKELFAQQETISIILQEKEAQLSFFKTREDKEIDKVITLENKVNVLDDIV